MVTITITTVNARRANTIIITTIIMIVVLEPPDPDDAFAVFITVGFVTVGVIVAEVVAPTCIKKHTSISFLLETYRVFVSSHYIMRKTN